jgi:hypothetical protein
MLHHAVVAAVDDVFRKANDILQPAHHRFGIFTAQRGIDAGRLDVAFVGHGELLLDWVSPRVCDKPDAVRLKICYPSENPTCGRVSRLSVSARRRAQAVGGSPASETNSRTRWA